MTKSMITVLVSGSMLIGTSMASLVAQPAQPAKTRQISAGKATLLIPVHLPGETRSSGTLYNGAVIMGSKGECDITFDHFAGIYWSERRIPGSSLLPTPAYQKVSEQAGVPLNLGDGIKTSTRSIKLTAEKPCGKIVEETINVVDLYCAGSRTFYAIAGMQDPFLTQQRIAEIAKSLKCS
jgi:hypothetical protein